MMTEDKEAKAAESLLMAFKAYTGRKLVVPPLMFKIAIKRGIDPKLMMPLRQIPETRK